MIMNFSVERENKRIKVEREFDAPVQKVWNAWTESKLLDQWWAPKPWKAQTKLMNFTRGGQWLYAMVGPDGISNWCKAVFKEVEPLKRFAGTDYFCDENGNIDNSFPVAHWEVTFTERNTSTLVNIQISFNQTADLDKYIEMGFREGFTAALENLDGMV
jgi:uncharacterized protein YndB with AHSA1/START domain